MSIHVTIDPAARLPMDCLSASLAAWKAICFIQSCLKMIKIAQPSLPPSCGLSQLREEFSSLNSLCPASLSSLPAERQNDTGDPAGPLTVLITSSTYRQNLASQLHEASICRTQKMPVLQRNVMQASFHPTCRTLSLHLERSSRASDLGAQFATPALVR